MIILILPCICCGNVAIIIVMSPVALAFSLTCLLIKTSVLRNLTTTIVFDELVVKLKGKQAAIRGAVCVITCCAVMLISSNSNDTACSNWQR